MEVLIKKLVDYVKEILQVDIEPEELPKQAMGILPLYISEMYRLHQAKLFNIEFLLIDCKDNENFSIFQLDKHISLTKESLNKKVVLLVENMSSLNRKRLIAKGINFIVPGKQMFLPDFLIDLNERFRPPRSLTKTEKLLPSAQFILLYFILHWTDKIILEENSFTQWAAKTGYTKMAITNAAESLVRNNLCVASGTKEKYLKITKERNELWQSALPFFENPVLKKIFIDELPETVGLLKSNESALPEYSDMNPSQQNYFAVVKDVFYNLMKSGQLKNPNEQEGQYCIELWKYNPQILVSGISAQNNVDPLSLYLSLQENHDERIESALEQIIERFVW